MPDGSYPPHFSSSTTPSSRTRDGSIPLPPAVVRGICGLSAPLAFVVAGLCFWFLVEPFGTNPPPKEVALIVGIASSAFGLLLVSIAVFYRGTPTQPQVDAGERLTRLIEPEPRWSPAGTAVVVPRTAVAYPVEKRRRFSVRELAGVGALLGIIIGPVIGYIAYQRQQVLDRGKPEARSMSVADLGRNGPGDNIHVQIKDFDIGDKYAVRTKNGSWTAVCLPAFPKGMAGQAGALKVVIRSGRVHSEDDLRELRKRATISGVVVNSIYEWESDRNHMKSAYPGCDPSSIWVVQEDYTFPNASEIKTLYAISSVIVGLAVFCGVGLLLPKGS